MVSNKLPHSPDLDKDKETYCNNAIVFLNSISPDSLYWGRYLHENNDVLIYDLISCTTKQKRKISNRKNSTKKKKSQLEELLS